MKLTAEQMLDLAKKHGFSNKWMKHDDMYTCMVDDIEAYTNAVLALRDEELMNKTYHAGRSNVRLCDFNRR